MQQWLWRIVIERRVTRCRRYRAAIAAWPVHFFRGIRLRCEKYLERLFFSPALYTQVSSKYIGRSGHIRTDVFVIDAVYFISYVALTRCCIGNVMRV